MALTEVNLFRIDGDLGTISNVQISALNGGPLSGARNRIINGDMRIAQRGTSVALGTTPTYFLDRFAGLYSTSVTGTLSQQSTGGLAGFTNCARAQRTSGQTATGNLSVIQILETLNCTDLAGGSVTLSFWARAGANYSATGSGLTAAVYTGTGTDQSASSFMSGSWTGQTAIINSGATLTTSWQKFTLTGSVGASATQLGVIFQGSLTGTAGANDFFEITGVQLEPGTVATPFERRSYGQELALCQRYCWVFGNSDNAPFGSGYETATIGKTSAALPVAMRATPTFSSTAANTFAIMDSGSSGRSGTAIVLDLASPTAVAVNLSCSGTTANAGCILRTASATATMTFNAEL